MTHLLCQLSLIPLSAVGPATFWWLWTRSAPERYVRVRVPKTVAGPVTLDSDHRGIVR